MRFWSSASSATTKPPSFPSLFLFHEPVQCHASIRYTCDSKQPWHVVRSAQSLLDLRVVFGKPSRWYIGACHLWNSGSICCRRRTDWLQLFFHWGIDDGSWTRHRYLSRRGFASRDNVVYASIPTRTLLRQAVLRRFQYSEGTNLGSILISG